MRVLIDEDEGICSTKRQERFTIFYADIRGCKHVYTDSESMKESKMGIYNFIKLATC